MFNLKTLILSFVILISGWEFSWALGDESKFIIPQIKYKGGSFKPRPSGIESLMAQLANRTSVEVKRASLNVNLVDPKLFQYPFIYLGGDEPFEPFPQKEINILRNYLNYGGFLLIDDNSARANSGFDTSARRLVKRLFVNTPLQRISRDHSIFRSFYLLNRVVGRAKIKSYLEGITIKGRTVLVYSSNDLAGAWSRSKLGYWDFEMIGGGNRQRTLSIRLGINIVMYALTLDYKKDMVHLPIILERLRRYSAR